MKYCKKTRRLYARVAPCAGAWIEIINPFGIAIAKGSPPARGRGLKSAVL